MDKREYKELEDFVDGVMAEAPMDTPSLEFTQNVLKKLEAETPKVYQYKPMLPKTAMVALCASFVALLVFVWSRFGLDSGQGWFKKLHLETWFQANWDWIGAYHASKVMVYAFLFLGLMFFVQVPWLKKQLNRTVS